MPLMESPESGSGVKVRMYRQGHGDCFLLAFPTDKERPFYVLIDCGYKPGSNVAFGLAKISDIVADIGEATGNHIDLVILTHEHQDHVNGIWKKGTPYFEDIKIGAAWLAWTEDPKDQLANDLRKRHHDQLLGLVAARNRLALEARGAALGRLDDLLSLELGFGINETEDFAAAAKDPAKSLNKQAMKLVKDKAGAKTKYIVPFEEILRLPGVEGVRIFAFGPPHDADLLADENPQGTEAFPGHGFGAAMHRGSFFAAAQAGDAERPGIQPFAKRFGIPVAEAFTSDPSRDFFKRFYDKPSAAGNDSKPEVADDAEFRRIDTDWLYCAEDLALVLNKGINNTSLALAFELEKSGKVLLFIGDAQRGNWKSWTAGSWQEGDKKITIRDLMARTVLYKVGHHGSHNATLAGALNDDYPNLTWMGQGSYGREFTAMITAVSKWAYAQTPVWAHPLKSIKEELVKKTAGRIFQTDTGALKKPDSVSDAEWAEFTNKTTITPLYFEYEIADTAS